MRIGVIVPMTGAAAVPTWTEIREFARTAEDLGFASLWVCDHLYNGNSTSEPMPIHEAWTIQTALAAVTARVELGQLVLCTAFRDPGVLAKSAVTADSISGGRLTLGLGAGWNDREYRDFGFPIESRFRRFAESLKVTLPLLRSEEVTYSGRFHQVQGARLLPPPERHIPILIAGSGPRMRDLVARHADAWNTAWFDSADGTFRAEIDAMKASLDAVGRPHSTLRRTVGFEHGANRPAADLTAAMSGFAEAGVDDLICIVEPETVAGLKHLAAAAAGWLT
jgi:probable F420-dependent oxidoreductase